MYVSPRTQVPPWMAARTLEVGLSLFLLSWVFQGSIELAVWTLEFLWS